MADKKISALTGATTPLAGTEVLPIVQSGATVKVAVSDLTAGRAVSAASLALTTALPVTSGGTGLATVTAGRIPYGNGTSAFNTTDNLFYDGASLNVGGSGGVLGGKVGVLGTAQPILSARSDDSTTFAILKLWANETTGNNLFASFATDSNAQRGEIYYNRTGGLTVYATTSDYRSKTIEGDITNSGEIIDSLKPYMGRMHGATMSSPMFVAHEFQEVAPYAVNGNKDDVNEDGSPRYQSMDSSVLVPILVAEIQSLRKRLETAGL